MKPAIVLFLASHPHGMTELKLQDEARQIEERIDHDAMQIVPRFATTWGSLIDWLTEVRPNVLHFSGHGSPAGQILLEKDGQPHPIDGTLFGRLLEIRSNRPRLVVLNACYTRAVALQIRKYSDCTIGTTHAVPDSVATEFAGDLYFHLSRGLSVKEAVDSAKIKLEGLGNPNHQIFENEYAPGVDPASVFIVPADGGIPAVAQGELELTEQDFRELLPRLDGVSWARFLAAVPGASASAGDGPVAKQARNVIEWADGPLGPPMVELIQTYARLFVSTR